MKKSLSVLLFFVGVISVCYAQWANVGGGLSSPQFLPKPTVYCITMYNSNIAVAGNFQMAGGKNAKNIAFWDGNQWSITDPVSNTNNTIYAMAVYNNELYAAGMGGDLQKWDGTRWSKVASYIGNSVNAMQVYNNELYVAGDFTRFDSQNIANIARYNGSRWIGLASGCDSLVNCLQLYLGKLLIGGNFTKASGRTVRKIATWDGATWEELNQGLTAEVTCTATYLNELYAGGLFPGGLRGLKGNVWETPLGGLKKPVYSLKVVDNELLLGGPFTETVAGQKIDPLIAFDNASFNARFKGPDGGGGASVYSIVSYKQKLYVGGTFVSAGTASNAMGLAVYDATNEIPVIIDKNNNHYIQVINREGVWYIDNTENIPEGVFSLYNTLGQLQYQTIVKPNTSQALSGIQLEQGLYCYSFTGNDGHTQVGKLIAK